MAKPPQTTIDFYVDTPITGSSSPVFQNAAQREAYWNARRVGTTGGNLYVRHTRGSVKVRIDTIGAGYANVTELSWLNSNYENKEFFARVVDFEVVSNSVVEFFFEVDWFQTYMFDVLFYSSHIEREGLTEAEYDQAVANPWRNDILELLTPEPDLPIARELEESYKLPATNVTSAGTLTDSITSAGGVDRTPITGGGKAGLVTQWPALAVGPSPSIVSSNTVVIALSTFPMVGDPYDNTSGGFKFSDLTGPANKSSANISWITPDNTRGGPTLVRPFYLIGFRMDRKVNIDFSRRGALINTVGSVQERLQRVMNLLARYDLSHMVVMGPVVVPTEIIDADINMQYMSGLTAAGQGGAGAVIVPAATGPYDSHGQPKLMRSPFRYVRVQAPDGSEISLMRERFLDPANPKLAVYSDFDGDPTLSAIPFQYDGSDIRIEQRLSYGAFPTLAYSTDGYLTQLGQMRQEALMGALKPSDAMRTSGAGDAAWMKSRQDIAGFNGGIGAVFDPANIKNALTSMTGGSVGRNGTTWANASGSDVANFVGKNAAQAGNAMSNAMNYSSDRAAADLVAERETQQVLDYARSGKTSDLPTGMLDNLRGAVLNTDFHAGNMANSLMMKFSRQGFKIFDVQLRDEYLELYANYFTLYGYASGRLGIPKIVQGMRGGVMPKFDLLDGQQVTYVKTNGIKIAGVPVSARVAIESMFNGGHRFIKGW